MCSDFSHQKIQVDFSIWIREKRVVKKIQWRNCIWERWWQKQTNHANPLKKGKLILNMIHILPITNKQLKRKSHCLTTGLAWQCFPPFDSISRIFSPLKSNFNNKKLWYNIKKLYYYFILNILLNYYTILK